MLHYPLLLAGLALLSSATPGGLQQRHGISPNVVFIITDDQDVLMNSMDYMGGLKAHLQDKGTTYSRHYCTVALCCPSRVNLWTGKAAHNTNVTDLSPPFGGYPIFAANGYNDNWLPVWLQSAGYKTYYTGKLMNSHTIHNYNKPPINGLDGHDFLLQPGTYRYTNPTFQKNNELPQNYPGEYSTDLLLKKSLVLLDEAVNSGSPFFLAIAPVAPHADVGSGSGGGPPIPAPKYAHLFPGLRVPRTANFNPDTPSGVSWVKAQSRLTEANIDYNDEWYRQRLRALQSVDELLNTTIQALETHGVLDNTYIVYTTDNGFHISQHRLEPGKRCPYEEDINIPLVIRGPGIPAGATADFVTSHTDLAPTILEWTGAASYAPNNLDGLAIPASDADASAQNWGHVQVEHWGSASDEGIYKNLPYDVKKNNTYKALRVIGQGYNLYYAVWCNNEHEMYDMTTDSAQMNNLASNSQTTILGVTVSKLQTRLDALLLVLKSCAGSTCYNPWAALHPGGSVSNLKQALLGKYDLFYQNQNTVKFEHCRAGYFPAAEQPEIYNTYTGSKKLTERDMWEHEHWLKYSD